MRPLVLLWGCLVLPGYGALTGPTEISGFEGDTVSIQCSYGERLRNHRKYWCRRSSWIPGILVDRCSGTIYTKADGQESTVGRVSIRDSPQELKFNVTLRELTLTDSGEYWCGVRILGFDETLLVSLSVLPGPCCSPSPTPFLQPLAPSLQPKAKAWQTQPPAPRTSGPPTRPDSASAEDASPLPSSSSSKSRVCPTTVRMLAPVLVLLALLLASGLCALGRYILRWRKKVQLATETQKNEKVHYSHLPLGKGQVPESAVIKTVEAHTGPAAGPRTEMRSLDQTSEQEESPLQAQEGEARPGPPLHMSEELRHSVFIPV